MINLSRIILIDHHAHSVLKDFSQLDAIGFRQAFSETNSLSMLQSHAQHSLHYMHMLHELSEYLDVEEEEANILEMRCRLGKTDYVQMLFDDASIGAVIVDAGFRNDDMATLESFAALAARPIYQCVRIEAVIESVLHAANSYEEAHDEFVNRLTHPSGSRTVSFKTIAAYRGGLSIDQVDKGSAQKNFSQLKSNDVSNKPARISRGALYHYWLRLAFEVAQELSIPVQIHCGLGDADADLRDANPWCFRSILEDRKFAKTNFVFLHCYPYVREAALLASLYNNVYMDLSLALSLISTQAGSLFADALAAAPSSKVLIATDGHSVPETYWYASHSARRGLAAVLSYLIGNGFVNEVQAMSIAERLFHKNAQDLYLSGNF
ncbi:MAG: amidohydrolase family protein [Candidatus Obscuribacterales bacterium]